VDWQELTDLTHEQPFVVEWVRLAPGRRRAACVFSASFAAGTLGVERADAGVASAVVNTAQQIGGSIGLARIGEPARLLRDGTVVTGGRPWT
jgi:hypothetical protein